MNWWVIIVETCLNSLYECFFVFVCWWGSNWCGCLWSLNEKWENGGFGGYELDDEIEVNWCSYSMFVVVSNVFWCL